jgi:hypothetical protein
LVAAGIFPFAAMSRLALGPTQPPIQWIPKALFPGIKRPDRQADHSPPSSVEVKNARSFALPIRPNGVVLRYRDNFHSPKG